jgi:hypothetical protein
METGSEPFTVLRETAPGTEFTCLLCGVRFTHSERVCASCPLSARCDVVACPRCGYQFPRTSWLVERARSLIARLRKGRGEKRSVNT